MELLQLKYFCEAAKLENFSKVAKKYYVPQSSISHTIARLEEELGTKLFTRSGRKVMLNEAGKVFWEEINASLSKLERGVQRVSDLRRSSIRISLLAGTVAMIPLIAAFQKSNPDVEVTFANPSDRHKGNLFFDLRIGAKPSDVDAICVSRPLFTERILTAVPADSPLAQKTVLTFEDIRGLPVVGLWPSGKLFRQMGGYFEQHDYEPKVIVETENHATVAEFVKNGFGIAFYPEISWSAVQKDGIVSLPLADFDCRRTIYLFWPKDYEPSEATKRFISFAVDWFTKKGATPE